MKLAPGTPLSAGLAFDPANPLPVARLAMDKVSIGTGRDPV
jgi:hypothetical protein